MRYMRSSHEEEAGSPRTSRMASDLTLLRRRFALVVRMERILEIVGPLASGSYSLANVKDEPRPQLARHLALQVP